eukprot:1930585-Pyramimonas_sp.AAC.1
MPAEGSRGQRRRGRRTEHVHRAVAAGPMSSRASVGASAWSPTRPSAIVSSPRSRRKRSAQ